MIINAKTRKWIEWNIVELLKEDKVNATEKIEIIAEDIMGIFEEGISEMSDEGLEGE